MLPYRYQDRISLTISALVVVLAFLLPLYRRGVSVVAPLLVLLWLLDVALRRRWSDLKRSGTVIAVLLFLLLNLISLLWSSNLPEAWDYIGKYRHLLLVPAIAADGAPVAVEPLRLLAHCVTAGHDRIAILNRATSPHTYPTRPAAAAPRRNHAQLGTAITPQNSRC